MSRISGKYAATALLTIATLAGVLGTASAHAERTAGDTVSIEVVYNDLDLASAAGVETLYQRLRGAARNACGERGKRINEIRAYHACYNNALQAAVKGFNSVRLTALHELSEEQSS
jgi:UrcA family protein